MTNREREQPIRIIKKKSGHGGHHGGAWKVAFADFMTAMMALFLVLWLVTQSSDVRAAIAGYFQDPLGHANEFGNSILEGDGAQAASVRPINDQQITELRRDRLLVLMNRIQSKMDSTLELSEAAEHIRLEMTKDGLRISLLEDSVGVFFELGSATPKPAMASVLALLGRELAGLAFGIVVEGHTDAVAYAPTFGYSNWELSTDRANAARQLLVGGGLAPEQVQEIRGHADRQLLYPLKPLDASNRRVTITLMTALPAGLSADISPGPLGQGGPVTQELSIRPLGNHE